VNSKYGIYSSHVLGFDLAYADYATKYPEAIALRDQEASTVSNALISLFSRVGIPKEMLTDQGSNFMSELMREVCYNSSNGGNPVLSFGTSLYADSKYGIYSSHVLGFDLAYAFNIFFSTPLNFSQSPLHIAWQGLVRNLLICNNLHTSRINKKLTQFLML
jgi:hypothetical protein